MAVQPHGASSKQWTDTSGIRRVGLETWFRGSSTAGSAGRAGDEEHKQHGVGGARA